MVTWFSGDFGLPSFLLVEALALLTMVIKSGEQSNPYSTWLAIVAYWKDMKDQNKKIGYRISTDAVSKPRLSQHPVAL